MKTIQVFTIENLDEKVFKSKIEQVALTLNWRQIESDSVTLSFATNEKFIKLIGNKIHFKYLNKNTAYLIVTGLTSGQVVDSGQSVDIHTSFFEAFYVIK